MKEKKKAVLFDLDGTLWDSTASVILAWNEVLEGFEDTHAISQEEMKSVMGFSMDQICDTLFPYLEKERREMIMKRCEDHENEYVREHGGILFDNVKKVLQALHENYFVGIVSNCQSGYIEAFLEHYDLKQFVDATRAFGDFHKEKAENIKDVITENGIEKAIYVGDIYNDYLSAQGANVPFVLARYGFAPFEYDTGIDSVEEIIQIASHML